MKKIDKMTSEQESQVQVYLDKWLKIGRQTASLDANKAIQAVKTIYRCAKLKEPKYFMVFPSPIQCQLAVAIIKTKEFQSELKNIKLEVSNLGNNLRNNLGGNLRSNLGNNLRNNLENNLVSNLGNNLRNNLENNLVSNLGNNLENNLAGNLWSNLENNLGNNLVSNLWNNLGNNLRSNLVSNLWNNLENNLGGNLRSNLGNSLRNNLENNLESSLGNNLRNNLVSNLGNNLENNLGNNLRSNLVSNLWNNLENNLGGNLGVKYESTFYGYYWFAWTAFYDFVLNVLFEDKIPEHKDFIEFTAAMKNIHMFIPFQDIVFICDTPQTLTLDTSGRLHGETEPAMMYADGYSLFYLNGVQVPKWAIETPKDDIIPKQVLELTNTEQRMALMRHVGLAKFMKDLNAEIIHEYKGYKLYYLTIQEQKIGPYLFMQCPSSGRQFLEGCGDPVDGLFIDKAIKTCQDALKWRATKASKQFMTKFNLKWSYSA